MTRTAGETFLMDPVGTTRRPSGVDVI